MYEDINTVLDAIKHHFETKFGESFEMNRSHRYVNFKSASYSFDVQAAFIQARTQSDFTVPIQDRIDFVLEGVAIKPYAYYRFSSKSVNKPFPIEYCIDLVEE